MTSARTAHRVRTLAISRPDFATWLAIALRLPVRSQTVPKVLAEAVLEHFDMKLKQPPDVLVTCTPAFSGWD